MSPLESTQRPDLVGSILDHKYRIESLIGQGGMGSVYRATHLGTQRPVALKLIADRWAANPEFEIRFRREAEALGRLRHANVINVVDFDVTSFKGRDVAFLAMEYLDGSSLAEYQREHTLPVHLILDIVEMVASALDAAHQLGVIHRDLKPENIWLEPNALGSFNVRVLDFGIAKMIHPSAGEDAFHKSRAALVGAGTQTMEIPIDPRTEVGKILGTPAYMSPEQCLGDPLDGRSDVYSLAVITYQMLAGQLPFQGNSVELIRKHLTEQPKALHEVKNRIPRAVSRAVMSGLAKNPEDRPVSATSFASLLRINAEGEKPFLLRGRWLMGAFTPPMTLLLLVHYVVGAGLAIALLVLLRQAGIRGWRLEGLCYLVLVAIFLVMGNWSKLVWSVIFREVMDIHHYDLSPGRVAIASMRFAPAFLKTQCIALFHWQTWLQPSRSVLWPVLCVMEDCSGREALDRSRELATEAPPVAVGFAIRHLALAVIATVLVMMPEIISGAMSRLGVVGPAVAGGFLWVSFTGVGTFVAYPLFYFRARRTRAEAVEPRFAALQAVDFPTKSIGGVSRGAIAWLLATLLGLGFAVYARLGRDKGNDSYTFVSTAELGQVSEMKKLLSRGADPNSRSGLWTALTRASLFGHKEAITTLLDAGADINRNNKDVGSALYLAVAANHDDVARLLLERGADPNLAPNWGLTPLMVAASQGDLPIIELLLQYRADPNRRSLHGQTAVDFALREHHADAADLIRYSMH